MFRPYFEVSLSEKYTAQERAAIASELIDYVISRTEEGKGIGGKEFGGYSKKYAELKGQDNVDLTFSGEMLNEIELLESEEGKLRIGFDEDYDGLGKVEGNVLGTYGQDSPIKGKKRNFLGVTQAELRAILDNYPLRDEEARQERLATLKVTSEAARSILKTIEVDEDD